MVPAVGLAGGGGLVRAWIKMRSVAAYAAVVMRAVMFHRAVHALVAMPPIMICRIRLDTAGCERSVRFHSAFVSLSKASPVRPVYVLRAACLIFCAPVASQVLLVRPSVTAAKWKVRRPSRRS